MIKLWIPQYLGTLSFILEFLMLLLFFDVFLGSGRAVVEVGNFAKSCFVML